MGADRAAHQQHFFLQSRDALARRRRRAVCRVAVCLRRASHLARGHAPVRRGLRRLLEREQPLLQRGDRAFMRLRDNLREGRGVSD